MLPSSKRIHPNCEMHKYAKSVLASEEAAVEYYFDSAEYIIKNMIKFMDETGLNPKDMNILDFAAGYGRFARYFINIFHEVTITDLEQEMLDFCRQEFHAKAFLSTPETLETCTKRYDMVFCFSLFTHLNEEQWPVMFRQLARLVRPGRYFILSTHSYKLFSQLDPAHYGNPDQQIKNFAYAQGNETGGRLDPRIYGTSIVTENYVREVASTIGEIELIKKYDMGEFDRYHDIYIFKVCGPIYNSKEASSRLHRFVTFLTDISGVRKLNHIFRFRC